MFFTKYDKNSFILIDLFNDFTDQHNMVKLGVRCEIKHDKRIRYILNNIHLRSETKSKMNESNDDLLKLDINSEEYPKEIRYEDHIYIKNIYYNTI